MTTPTPLINLELDLINVCNARCPLCHFRNNYPESLETTAQLTREFLEQALDGARPERVFLAGDLGEPTLSPHLFSVLEYFVETNPSVCVVMNTNGCTKTHDFWRKLARRLPECHEVVFALDGLEDTYATYRVGLDFERTIGNAKAFIAAGGRASWGFIEFQHNAHQLEEAQRRAHELGFFAFRRRDSYDESTEIRRADNYEDNHEEIEELWRSGSVNVTPKVFPYIQADGTVYPCCESNSGRYDPKVQFDFDSIDAGKKNLTECMQSLPEYCRMMQSTYPLTCFRRCGDFPESVSKQGFEIGFGRKTGPR